VHGTKQSLENLVDNRLYSMLKAKSNSSKNSLLITTPKGETMKTNRLNKMLLTLTLLATLPSVNAETIGRFQVKQGIATDSATGLTWMRCPLGMKWDGESCAGKATLYKWDEALQTPNGFNYAGHNDWRLPTIDELKTLIDKDAGNQDTGIPFINSVVFPRTLSNNEHGYFWSSSPSASSSNYAWIVSFSGGYGGSGS
jgi:hypothetical protein